MLTDLTPEKAVRFAMMVEERGARFYAELASRFEDSRDLSELFSTLARDEERHRRQFAGLLRGLAGNPDPLEGPDRDYLEAMALGGFFALSGGPFARSDEIRTQADALQRVFNFEKATLGYYQAMQDVLGESEALSGLIEAEKRHVINVTKLMLTDAEVRSLEDTWP